MKHPFLFKVISIISLSVITSFIGLSQGGLYPIVDTDVQNFYNNAAIISTPASGQAFYGQDGNYINSPNARSFTDNGNGTITDNVTQLVWTKCPMYSSGQLLDHLNNCFGSNGNFDWENAIDACSNLNSDSFAGLSDWRLPEIEELETLIDYGRSSSAAIDEMYFPNTEYLPNPDIPYYFSATTNPNLPATLKFLSKQLYQFRFSKLQ